MNWRHCTLLLLLFYSIAACVRDQIPTPEGLAAIPYNPQAYNLERPTGFPVMFIPTDNPTTIEGVNLGRQLFYDPILSLDSTMSCATCHLPVGSFTDNEATSFGVDGILGKRSSMSLLNAGYYTNGLFWDGRANTLEEQALLPVEDEVELHETWPNVIQKLQRHPSYPIAFRKAFGITDEMAITKELAAKAIAQFERSLISGNSKYDQVIRGETTFTPEEQLGWDIFFDVSDSIPDGECAHCHNEPFFTTNEYFNNGVQGADNLNDFSDLGRGLVTGNIFDNGKFRAPTLRNIALTAPYMHKGRFDTLNEVLIHYNTGGNYAENLSPLIRPLTLSGDQKNAVIAFLHTLTDTTFTQNPAYQNPFE